MVESHPGIFFSLVQCFDLSLLSMGMRISATGALSEVFPRKEKARKTSDKAKALHPAAIMLGSSEHSSYLLGRASQAPRGGMTVFRWCD